MKNKDLYLKLNFYPGFLGFFFNPFYISRTNLFKYIKVLSGSIEGNIVDIGCGLKPYKHFFFKSKKYIGVEIKDDKVQRNNFADIYYDGKKLPFDSNSIENILTFQVLEHVFNPDIFLSEINRVLKKDGNILITVPFMWDEHEQPYDYGRYSSFGIEDLLKKNGFKVLKKIKSTNGIVSIIQLFIGYVFKKTRTRFRILNHILSFIICILFNPITLLLNLINSKNGDIFLDNIVLAKKISK
ncbi:class I SAM-dependent methyltransferase [Flavobacteriaceae bacterium]|nr:class I SAM-dependent methyltransferase [Flavobacteriaceae bacterium]